MTSISNPRELVSILVLSQVEKETIDTINEDGCKFAASIMLLGLSRKIVIPTREEWYGLNMLERDAELRRMN